MKKISDNELIGELKNRLEENRRGLHDLEVLTKKLETVNRKLQESEAMKSHFLSNIRNEINNPLTSIMALSQQLAAGEIESEIMESMGKLIYNEAFELNFQLQNIFMAAELEAGEATLSIARIDVETFLHNTIEEFRHVADRKRVKLNYEFRPNGGGKEKDEDIFFRTDPEKLRICMANLLANAIEFSYEGKQVWVKASLDDSHLKVIVEDEGIGIANEKQKEIFDRFKQLDSGMRKTHKGHGLGLSIVKALLDLMDGEVRFTSIAGKGCTFTFSVRKYISQADDVDVFSGDGNEFIFEDEEKFSEGGDVQSF